MGTVRQLSLSIVLPDGKVYKVDGHVKEMRMIGPHAAYAEVHAEQLFEGTHPLFHAPPWAAPPWAARYGPSTDKSESYYGTSAAPGTESSFPEKAYKELMGLWKSAQGSSEPMTFEDAIRLSEDESLEE